MDGHWGEVMREFQLKLAMSQRTVSVKFRWKIFRGAIPNGILTGRSNLSKV
jgi:hypothetical protein